MNHDLGLICFCEPEVQLKKKEKERERKMSVTPAQLGLLLRVPEV